MQFVATVAVLVSLAFSVQADKPIAYKVGYFQQQVDHFNFVQSATFQQRYIYTGKQLTQLKLLVI